MRSKGLVLVMCRDSRLNESLRTLFEFDGYRTHIVNSVPDAHIWWNQHGHKLPADFQLVQVTRNGKGADYWALFTSTVPAEHHPPVEICA